jgi:hypothetical protein
VQRGEGVKAFAQSLPGKIALTLLAGGIAAASFAYIGILIALGAFLLFMLALPIYLGWKRPRELAVAGLVAMLVAAPISSLAYTAQFRTPVAPVSSDAQNGGSVLSDAQVRPFAGAAGGTYDFSVQVNPQYLPAGAHAPEYVVVYLSTCNGAITSNNSACGGGGYPFWVLNQSFSTSLGNVTNVTLHQKLNMPSLWYWEMAFVFQSATNQSTWVWVDPGLGNTAVQGPVSGDFTSTFTYVLPDIFGDVFLYLGLVFYAGLLVYLFLRNRRERRAAAEAAPAPGMGGSPPSGPPGGPGAPARPMGTERSCPKCGAVIYPAETTCWKCGAAVPPAAPVESPPLA